MNLLRYLMAEAVLMAIFITSAATKLHVNTFATALALMAITALFRRMHVRRAIVAKRLSVTLVAVSMFATSATLLFGAVVAGFYNLQAALLLPPLFAFLWSQTTNVGIAVHVWPGRITPGEVEV